MTSASQFINPAGLCDPSAHGYTHVAIASPGATIVYIAGQGGEDADGKLANDFASQVKQAFTNLQIALTAAGTHPEHVLKLTTLVVDHDRLKLQQLGLEVQAIWGSQTPAQTLIPVPRLALDGMLFEVDAVVAIPNQ
jgi:enamine deaminase RidA (YjgF/YER057c/UK114 family)